MGTHTSGSLLFCPHPHLSVVDDDTDLGDAMTRGPKAGAAFAPDGPITLEFIMEATKPGAEANRDQATSDRDADEGVSGGGLVEEEDIGTEGAGTEPWTIVDDDARAIDSSSDDARARSAG